MGTNSKEPYVKLVTVTPDQAREWLEANYEGQRKIEDRTVAKYARDMIASNWRVTGDSIKFTKDGKLIDGQHRLWAIVMAERPVDIFVAFNVEESAYLVLDTGKKRNFADLLRSNQVPNAENTSGMVSTIMVYSQGRTVDTHFFTVRPSITEMYEFYLSLGDTQPSLRAAFRSYDRLRYSVSILGALHYVASLTETADVDAFYTQLANGIELEKGSPILALRSMLLRRAAERNDKRYSSTYYGEAAIKAWNAYAKGQHMSLLRGRSGDEPRPEVWDPQGKVQARWPR